MIVYGGHGLGDLQPALGVLPSVPKRPTDDRMAAFAYRGPYGLWRLKPEARTSFLEQLKRFDVQHVVDPAIDFDVPARFGKWPVLVVLGTPQGGYAALETGLDWYEGAAKHRYVILASPGFFDPMWQPGDDLERLRYSLFAIPPSADWAIAGLNELGGAVIVDLPGPDYAKWAMYGAVATAGGFIGWWAAKRRG